MGLLNIYATLIANWLNGGNFAKRSRMAATDIVCDYNLIWSKSSVKKVFRIAGIKPENVDLGFIDYIRTEMFNLNPDVEVIINTSYYPTRIDVNSDKFNRQMSRANEGYSSYSEAFNSQSGLARLTGKTYRLPGGGRLRLSKERLSDLKQVFLSYFTLYNHCSTGGTCALTEVFIELIGENAKDVKRAATDLWGLVGQLDMGMDEVRGVLKTYMEQHGPAVSMPNKLNKKFLPQLLFTDENQGAWSTFRSRGLVGGGKHALLLGVDYRSRLPFSVDLFKTSAAQIFLLLGRTGSGKTYAAFQFALSALAAGIYVSALDIKGREWIKLAPYTDYKVLSFDEQNPSFVNTLRLDDIVVTSDNAMEVFQIAVNGTVNFFSLMVNLQPGEGAPTDMEMILREAVIKAYSMRGVTPNNPETFKRTSDMTYSEILPIIESLSTTQTYSPEQRKMAALVRSRAYAYVGSSGILAEAFKNEVSLGDVMDAHLVIYEFNKNQNAMTDSLDTLRIFMVQYLDSKKMASLKAQGKFMMVAYEELQRCDQFGNLLAFICANVTGARSNNCIVLLLMNSLRVLEGESARDIRSNVTSLIAGFCEQNDVRTIREDFARPWVASQLELFFSRPNLYRNVFAADVDDGLQRLLTTYKVMLPNYISEQFRTRTILED